MCGYGAVRWAGAVALLQPVGGAGGGEGVAATVPDLNARTRDAAASGQHAAANSRCRAIGFQTVAGVSHPLVISLAVRDFEKSSVFRSNWYQVGSSSEL